MGEFAKLSLKAILVSVIIVIFTRVIYIFPFYMGIVIETFNLANVAATDNYVKESYYERSINALESVNLRENVRVKIDNGERVALMPAGVGDDDEYYYSDLPEKPYVQRGETIIITVSAEYVVKTKFWDRDFFIANIPMSFSITTTGLRYYKDLEYAYWDN